MIESQNKKVSIVRQCKLLQISHTSVYNKPQGENSGNLKPMRLIDAQYLKTPCYGSRSMVTFLEVWAMTPIVNGSSD